MSDLSTAKLPAPSPLVLRDEFVNLIHGELLGPAGGPQEKVYEADILDRYVVGLLAPRGAAPPTTPADEQGEFAQAGAGGEDGDAEQVAPSENIAGTPGDEGPRPDQQPEQIQGLRLMPSAIGLTFVTDRNAADLEVTVKWGIYKREQEQGPEQKVSFWQRYSFLATTVVPVAHLDGWTWSPDPERPEIRVRAQARIWADGLTITLYLVNGQLEPKKRRAEAWLFQPEVSVRAVDGSAAFIKRNLPDGLNPRAAEDRAIWMRHRKQREFAVGHGVGVHAEPSADNWRRATQVATRIVPAFEVERVEPPPVEDLLADMDVLSTLSRGQFADALQPLTQAYADWLEARGDDLREGRDELGHWPDEADGALNDAQQAMMRIQAGIELLDENEQAAAAFRFMNEAMALQRIRTLYAADVRRGEAPDLNVLDVPVNRSWRPFQMAFILINLPALTDPTHPERSGDNAVADLLWFPTGGGKTEAYLGLTAFTLAIRRLQGTVGEYAGGAGVAVLMRYTLRLLTLQQFQRSTALIAACEVIRRRDPSVWGIEPFRIGLWVGQSSTPNYTDNSHEAVEKLRTGGYVNKGTPAQLTHCPWCGSEIDPGRNIRVETFGQGRARTFQFCSDKLGLCPFSERQSPDEGLPILVVDEEIYRRLPSLLIATVDKFAQMPWKGQIEMLFGRVTGYCPRHGYVSPEIEDDTRHNARGNFPAVVQQPVGHLRPPDLIIQDELHLISGPLGTLVGLYETAVDALSSWQLNGTTVKPKIIASTATVRRAREQVRGVFARDVSIFPPPGLDADDSFFAVKQEKSDDAPGRLYLGICATGLRFKSVMIRVYVAAMAAAQSLYKRYGEAADPYMTLVGYFNSIRELGGMRRVMDDTINSRLRRMERRGLANREIYFYTVDELTSRKNASEIPRTLNNLERPYDPAPKGNRLDAILATNMISVGVDVPRLGLMVVANQPKTTAEYIQATSRVGRRHPGVVITVMHWARPRDVSHYERFEHYHSTFYQQVEALSVTPFAPRALDRALSGVLVSAVRQASHDYNPNKGASRLRSVDESVKNAVALIQNRASQVTNDPMRQELLGEMLTTRIKAWISSAKRPGSKLGYEMSQDGKTLGLLHHPSGQDWDLFTCLNSLREVEPNVNLILNDHGMDSGVSEDDDAKPA
jgi:hypothetical protein